MRKQMMKKGLAVGLSALVFLSAVPTASVQAVAWKQNSTGWWWQEDNGSYPVSQWKNIGGNWYYFDQNGYMKTGWYQEGNDWYYLGAANDGVMKTGWQQVNGTWYYMNANGKMAADAWIGNYYVDSSGAWTKTKRPVQWIPSGNRWWYQHEDGGYTTNGFEKIGGQTYYFDKDGWMVTGWRLIKNAWYYFHASGAMATNVWVEGTYYVGEDGVMATDTWIGSYYVDSNGKWVPGKEKDGLISLDKKEEALWIGEETTLQVSYDPKHITADQTVKWSSSDPEIAIVENGKVRGVAEGTATIVAEVAGEKAVCKVSVVPEFKIEYYDFYLTNRGYLPFGLNETDTYGTAFFANRTDSGELSGVTWSVSDETVVKWNVDEEIAYLTGIKEGTTTLTASYKGKSVSLDIKTKRVEKLQELQYSQEIYTRKAGEKFTLYPGLYPENAYLGYGDSLYFESSNPDVATVYDGVIRTKKEGYTTITAWYEESRQNVIRASCTLKVEGKAENATEPEMIRCEPVDSVPDIPLGLKTKLNIVVYPVTYLYDDSDIKLEILGGAGPGGEGGDARIEDGEIIGTKTGPVLVRASLDGCEPIEFTVRVSD